MQLCDAAVYWTYIWLQSDRCIFITLFPSVMQNTVMIVVSCHEVLIKFSFVLIWVTETNQKCCLTPKQSCYVINPFNHFVMF